MSEQGAEPPEGLQEQMIDVLNGLYIAGGYASITWRLPDGSLLNLSRTSSDDEPVMAAVQ